MQGLFDLGSLAGLGGGPQGAPAIDPKMNDTSGQQTWENWMKGLADDSNVTIK